MVEMSYSATLAPAGFHPVLGIAFEPSLETTCDLFAFVALPPSFIPDRFQLHQLHLEGRLGAYDPLSPSSSLVVSGSRDLEAPVSRAEGASVLLRLASGGKGKELAQEHEQGQSEVHIPLHLRYQVPVAERWGLAGDRRDTLTVELDSPLVFYACGLDDERALSPSLLSISLC